MRNPYASSHIILDTLPGDLAHASHLDRSVRRGTVVPLPGNRDAWPQDVVEGARALAVVEKEHVPYVNLPPGTHTITGH